MLAILIAIFILFLIRALTKKKTLSIWIGVVLFVVSAAKNIAVNSDLPVYEYSYLSMKSYALRDLWNNYIAGTEKDFGFYFFSNLFSELGFGVGVWFGIIALIFAILVAVSLYQNSSDPFISVIILFAFYFAFTLSGLRQTIAMGLVLLSYRYIREKKIWPYLAILVVAFFFHSSVIIFFPAYWLAHFKIGYKQLIVVGAAFIVCYSLPQLVFANMELIVSAWNLPWHFSQVTALNWSGYIIQLCLLVFCYVFRLNVPLEQRKAYVDPYINLMVIGLCLQGASSIVGEAFRLSYYYSMAGMLALPNIITNMERNNAKLAYLGVCGVLIAYIVYANSYAGFTFFEGILS